MEILQVQRDQSGKKGKKRCRKGSNQVRVLGPYLFCDASHSRDGSLCGYYCSLSFQDTQKKSFYGKHYWDLFLLYLCVGCNSCGLRRTGILELWNSQFLILYYQPFIPKPDLITSRNDYNFYRLKGLR